MTRHRSIAFVFALSAALLSARPALAEADPYEDALARSRAAERHGDLRAAAQELEAVVPAYPQDYAIALQLGWTYFRIEDYAAAERAYRIALARAPRALDARTGLAWSLARQKRCEEALIHFREALALAPSDASAAEGVSACASPLPAEAGIMTLSAGLSDYLFPNHPIKTNAVGFVGTVAVALPEGWLFGASYRYLRFGTTDTSSVSPFSQHEAYLHAGFAVREYGALLHGALVFDGSGALGTSKHLGVSARWSPLGDLLLDATLSVYDDLTVLRIAPSWRIPVTKALGVVPGLAMQRAGSETLYDASLSLVLEGKLGSVFVGAKYGDEVRPAYLGQVVVYDIKERVKWGAWAGARTDLTKSFGLHFTYAIDHLERSDSLAPKESNTHAFTLGPTFRF